MKSEIQRRLQSVIDGNAHAIALMNKDDAWFDKEYKNLVNEAQATLKRVMGELVVLERYRKYAFEDC